jgi:hypothetical protein
MTINVDLNAEDYLVHLLYAKSNNKESKKKRINSWLTITGSSFLIAFAFYVGDNWSLSLYSLLVGIITLFFYPLYQRSYYKDFYSKYIHKNYQYRFGKESIITFQPDYIDIKDATFEGKLFASELKEIAEISTHYFIKFKIGESIIIPKRQVNQKTFLSEILSIFSNPNIVVQNQLGWRWK